MSDSIFATFNISGQGLSVQRKRLTAVANNIANANTTNGPDGLPYQREIIAVKESGNTVFSNALQSQLALTKTSSEHSGNISKNGSSIDNTVLESESVKDQSAPRMVYDPSHPDADDNGYVKMPNINIITEMVEMISASRAFQANTDVIESAKNIARNSLEI